MGFSQLQKSGIRIYRALRPGGGVLVFFSLILIYTTLGLSSCASLPRIKHTWHRFPEEATTVVPKRPFQSLGYVKARVNFPTLDPDHDERRLCENYFNKAVRQLVDHAKRNGADAVIEVRSVVFLMDGRIEHYPTPECVDGGGEGQVLTQGIAVKWIPPEEQEVKAQNQSVR